ncbi:MAG: site-specific DNA-methyltransferase [Lewinellaceae bacterium]|nr:site-specific DNA-methyltransferase [Phaeodactylibacter sp.]MCB9037557.1 site-specific DNA-methyltransferase [Lewinellaceae bacterium]
MLLKGDSLVELKKIKDETVDMVYLDPPFFTQKTHSLKSKEDKVYSFNDIWSDINSYKDYIQLRLKECQRVIKPTGSIFLHCDRSASHYLRIALDEVFGYDNFRSEIVWYYRRWSNAKKGLLNSHQLIFFYSKTKEFKFNTFFTDYSPTTNLDQIFQKRVRGKNGKTTYKKSSKGETELMNGKQGVPLLDVWEIPYLNPKAKERVGYPTQKPILLLERIISISTDVGDLVLDPFCGSGTTLVAAKILDRKFIGIDISNEAIQLAKSRISQPIKTKSALLEKGRNAYLNQDSQILSWLESIDCQPVQRNKGIDGFLRINGMVKPIPVKIQREGESFTVARKRLISAAKKNGYERKILIRSPNMIGIQLNFQEFEELNNEKLIIVNNLDKFIKNKEHFISEILDQS